MSLSFDYVKKYTDISLGFGSGEISVKVKDGVITNVGFCGGVNSGNQHSTRYYEEYEKNGEKWNAIVDYINDNNII